MSGEHGGRRVGGGRRPDPFSARQQSRPQDWTWLPAEGHTGPIPAFPLPSPSLRELELWATSWRLPQGVGWAPEPWRHDAVAHWVRWSVRAEDHDASAAVATMALRFANQIGMTPNGLRDLGWRIADPVEPAPGPGRPGGHVTPDDRRGRFAGASIRERLRALDDGGEERPSALERARRRAEERTNGTHPPDDADDGPGAG